MLDRQCRYAAYAGIQHAYSKLLVLPAWTEGWPTPQPLVQNPDLRYTVDIDQLGPGELYIFSQGYPKDQGRGKAVAAFGVNAFRPIKVFQEGGFGYSQLTLSGSSSKTDAYDSTLGYSEAEALLEGHVGSSGTVKLVDSKVQGDIVLAKVKTTTGTPDPTLPPPATPPAKLETEGSASVTGQTITETQTRQRVGFDKPYDDNPTREITDVDVLPPASPKDSTPTLEPGSYKSISVAPGKTLMLVEGDYYFSEGFHLDEAKLVIPKDSKVRVFIGGEMTAKNSTINPPDYDNDGKMTDIFQPKDLCLFFLDERIDPLTGDVAPSLLSSEGSLFNSAIAGLGLQAELRDGTVLYGAVNGDSVDVVDSKIHYDKSLEETDMSSYTKWQLRGLAAEQPKP